MNYKKWLSSDFLEEEYKEVLKKCTDEEKAALFSTALDFGTGGMRGILGVGPNRMNKMTVARAALGFGKYFIAKKVTGKIIIGYDNRHYSREFAEVSAGVLSALGFDVMIFEELIPTPIVSFAIRLKKAIGGIMITASHNPSNYNGFKIYDNTGCQFLPLEIKKVKAEIEKLAETYHFSLTTENVGYLGQSVKEEYLKQIHLENNQTRTKLKIGYSPQHGTGITIMGACFLENGFSNLVIPEEQAIIDPDFTNTASPNPEEPAAFDLLREYGRKYHLDLLLATDPDADRLGAYYSNAHGEYQRLTGNQIGAIFTDYLCRICPENLQEKYLVTTIVSSNLGKKIAASFGVQTVDVLTGFKYIGDQINQLGAENFLLGYEESFGFLYKSVVRDKDGIQAALLLAEIAAAQKKMGKNLGDYLTAIYEEFGYHYEELISINFENNQDRGASKRLYVKIIDVFEAEAVVVEDYENGWRRSRKGKETTLFLPREKVMKFIFSDDSFICVRPSGTEPKMKIYIAVWDRAEQTAKRKLEEYIDRISKLQLLD